MVNVRPCPVVSVWTNYREYALPYLFRTDAESLTRGSAARAATRLFNVPKPAPDLIRGSKFKVILDCSNRRLNGTYVLREEGEAYRSHFSGKNETGKLGSRSTYGIVPSLFQPPQISETLTLFRPPFFSFMVTVIKEVT